jgi:hypothetical protein
LISPAVPASINFFNAASASAYNASLTALERHQLARFLFKPNAVNSTHGFNNA